MVVQKGINEGRFIVTAIAACAVSVLVIMISKSSLESNLEIALGSFLSTLVAFRWFWSTRYSWGNYIISVRPLFQTVSYIFLIIGPLPALAGVNRFLYFPGATDYYWYLYLAAPLAFIFYELGFERALVKMTKDLHPLWLKTLTTNSNLIIIPLYVFIILFFRHFSSKYGINTGGLSAAATKEGLTVKVFYYLFNGFFGVCLFLIAAKWSNRDLGKKALFLIMGLTLFAILALSSSRTNSVIICMMVLAAFQLSKDNNLYKYLKYIIIIPILFILTTAIRQGSNVYSNTEAMSVNTKINNAELAVESGEAQERTKESLIADFGYRMNGIDWAGAMIQSHYRFGTPFMYGYYFLWGVYQSVPEVFLPFQKTDSGVNAHFILHQVDPNGTIFGWIIADGGILGVIIGYFAIGFFHGSLWGYAASPKTPQSVKLGYLALIPALMLYQVSLGEYIFENIRNGILFALLFWILITGVRLFLPPTRYKRIFINNQLLGTKPGD
ncbi:MAG: hypothetical protein WCF59_13140 [Desulfobaccales bacterium]